MKPNQQEKAIGGSRLSKRSHRSLKELVDLRIKPCHQILRVLSFTQFIKLLHLTKQKQTHYCTEKDGESDISENVHFPSFFSREPNRKLKIQERERYGMEKSGVRGRVVGYSEVSRATG
jgi:hypothetical protein